MLESEYFNKKQFYLKVAGVTHEGRQQVVANLKVGEKLLLIPDGENPYDEYAVKVETCDGKQVGFIPAENNRQIFRNLMNGNCRYSVHVSAITGGCYGKYYGCNIEVSYAEEAGEDNNLGASELYKRGLECYQEKSYSQAVSYWYKAAKMGNADAQFRLANCYNDGIGASKDFDKAYYWLQMAASQGDGAKQYALSEFCRKFAEENCESPYSREYPVRGGNGPQYMSFNQYYGGRSPRNSTDYSIMQEEYKNYCQDCEDEYEEEYGYLEPCYEDISYFYNEANKWLWKAAENGYVLAQIIYAKSCLDKNKTEEGAKYAKKAAEQGFVPAEYLLGVLYQNGIGVEQSFEKAAKWIGKAAINGDDKAQYHMGAMYTEGIGVNKSPVLAAMMYQESAQKGNAEAQYSLGYCYLNGCGVPESEGKALYWFQKAAENGHPEAQFNIACCYEAGIKVERNIDKAIFWYRKSASGGYEQAKDKLRSYGYDA